MIMGRIKTLLAKNTAKKLIKVHSQEFTQEFDKNKQLVAKYTNITSTKMRNVIAGYTTRLIKQKILELVRKNQPFPVVLSILFYQLLAFAPIIFGLFYH